MTFTKWIDTYIEEKGIDTEEILTVNSTVQEHFIPVAVVIEHMKIASDKEKKLIKDTIVKIDFQNGDTLHYLTHLATCIARVHDNV